MRPEAEASGYLSVAGERMAELRSGRAWMTNSALCVLGMGLLLLTRQFIAENGHFTIGFSGCSGWSVWLYVAAMVVVLTQPVDRATFWIVVGFGFAFQMMTVFAEPFMSSDIYRYVWDGVVQHAGVNPYRYVPGDKALTWLRAPNQEVFDNINRRDYARTIYPPVAQMVYWVATFVSPTVVAMKALMVGFECVTGAALVALLRRMGRPREQVLLFAWCPLLAWEIGGGGHVDAAVFCFVVLAMLFRHREQPVWTGLFLGLAVMTKFYPLVLFPALWTRPGGRWDWKMPTVVAAVVAVGYGCYLSVGKLVFGFLFDYTKEEGIDSGARFFLLDWVQHVRGLAGVPVGAYLLLCVAVLGGIAVWALRVAGGDGMGGVGPSHPTHEDKAFMDGAPDVPGTPDGAPGVVGKPKFVRAAMMLAFAMMILFSPHYAWYVVWLVPLFALAPNLPLLAYLMGFFYLFTTALADPGPKMFLLNEILYGGVAAVMVLQVTVLRRWPLRRVLR